MAGAIDLNPEGEGGQVSGTTFEGAGVRRGKSSVRQNRMKQ